MSTLLQPLDVTAIRKDFPLLSRILNGKPVVYLDSAVSGQMPLPVIERMVQYERLEHTNVHRGVSTLSQQATDFYEAAREKVRKFIGAGSSKEIVWTRGTTEAINLVAQSYGLCYVKCVVELMIL